MNASLSPRESFWEVDDSALSQFTPVKDGDVRSKGRPQLSPTSRQAAERYYKELSEFGDASPVGGQTFAPIGDGFDGNATGGSGGQPAEKQSTISNLQQQLKTFSKKVETGKRELAKLEAEIAQLKDSIQQGTAERGGFRAVQENASVVAKAELIMDKRVAKATAMCMAVHDRNSKLRQEIDASRHDRNAQLTAGVAMEKEIKSLIAESARLEASIQQKALARDEVELEIGSLEAEGAGIQAELEQTWMSLSASAEPPPSYGEELTSPDGGTGASPQPSSVSPPRMSTAPARTTRSSVNLRASMSRSSVLQPVTQSEFVSDMAKLENAREVFDTVLSLTGVESLSEFVKRFEDAEEKNYSIFKRVDGLALESETLRAQICAAREETSRAHARQEAENRWRKEAMEQIQFKIQTVKDSTAKLAAYTAEELACQQAIRRGLNQMLEVLAVEDSPVLHEASLGDYFGIIENRIHEVLLWCYQKINRRPPSSPINVSLSSTARSKDRRASKEGASKEPTVVNPDNVLIGPSTLSGTLNRTLLSQVVAPSSLEGPKDSRQTAAFNEPFLIPLYAATSGGQPDNAMDKSATGSNLSTESFGSIRIEEEEGKPLAVPPPSIRNYTAKVRFPINGPTSVTTLPPAVNKAPTGQSSSRPSTSSGRASEKGLPAIKKH